MEFVPQAVNIPQNRTARSPAKIRLIMMMFPSFPGICLSGTASAETVNDRLAAVDGEGMFIPEMRENLLHERTVHVDQLPASAAFEMEMQGTSGGIELITGTLTAAAGKFFEFSLFCESRKCPENGRFSGVHLPDKITCGKTAIRILREKAEDSVALSGTIRCFFCHKEFT
jgi:hypothetical protein